MSIPKYHDKGLFRMYLFLFILQHQEPLIFKNSSEISSTVRVKQFTSNICVRSEQISLTLFKHNRRNRGSRLFWEISPKFLTAVKPGQSEQPTTVDVNGIFATNYVHRARISSQFWSILVLILTISILCNNFELVPHVKINGYIILALVWQNDFSFSFL